MNNKRIFIKVCSECKDLILYPKLDKSITETCDKCKNKKGGN